MNVQTETAVAVIPPAADLPALFGKPDAIEKLLADIEAKARAEAPDVTTAKGRAAIASLANKVARSKTTLDDAGKKLNEDARAHINAVDAERRKIRDRMDALKIEVRAPLTQWEEREKARVDALEDRVARLASAAPSELEPPAATIAALIAGKIPHVKVLL